MSADTPLRFSMSSASSTGGGSGGGDSVSRRALDMRRKRVASAHSKAAASDATPSAAAASTRPPTTRTGVTSTTSTSTSSAFVRESLVSSSRQRTTTASTSMSDSTSTRGNTRAAVATDSSFPSTRRVATTNPALAATTGTSSSSAASSRMRETTTAASSSLSASSKSLSKTNLFETSRQAGQAAKAILTSAKKQATTTMSAITAKVATKQQQQQQQKRQQPPPRADTATTKTDKDDQDDSVTIGSNKSPPRIISGAARGDKNNNNKLLQRLEKISQNNKSRLLHKPTATTTTTTTTTAASTKTTSALTKTVVETTATKTDSTSATATLAITTEHENVAEDEPTPPRVTRSRPSWSGAEAPTDPEPVWTTTATSEEDEEEEKEEEEEQQDENTNIQQQQQQPPPRPSTATTHKKEAAKPKPRVRISTVETETSQPTLSSNSSSTLAARRYHQPPEDTTHRVAKVLWKDVSPANAEGAATEKSGSGSSNANDATYTLQTPREVVATPFAAPNVVNDDNPDEDDDDEPKPVQTLEDVEPTVDQVHVDAACMESRAVVRLQPYHIHNPLQQNQQSSQEDDEQQQTELSVMPSQITILGWDWSSPVLCYGDHVQLLQSSSPTEDTMGVGVVEATNQIRLFKLRDEFHNEGENQDQNDEHPSSGGGSGDNLLWQIFRGDPSIHLIRVGHAAQEHRQKELQNRTAYGQLHTTAPVHSGEPIVLRHVATGGILSFWQGEWRVLTSSYQQEQEPVADDLVPPNAGKVPLNRLRDHNLIVPSLQEIFSFVLDTVPWTTAWMHGGPKACRKFLANSYLRFPDRHGVGLSEMDESANIASNLRQDQAQSMVGQEKILVDELLGSYLGLEGTFVRAKRATEADTSLKGQRIEFYVADSTGSTPETGDVFDRGVCTLVEDLLFISNSFVLVEEFVAKRLHRFEYGSVMQALCSCLDEMMQEHSTAVASIEEDYRRERRKSLRELQVISQPLADTLAVLSQVVYTAVDRKGGALINGLRLLLVHQYQGNSIAEKILERLLDEASKPFMTMLDKWLTSGVLYDPCKEFMIQCHENEEWNGRYELDHDNTLEHFFPTTMEARRVLMAGKYWDGVRSCNDDTMFQTGSAKLPSPTSFTLELQYRAKGAQVASHIQKLYKSASETLLKILLEECDLVGTLRLMKRYFLLDQGDFFLNFLDAAEDELSREPARLRQFRVQHLLQVSIQITEGYNDASKDEISPLRISPDDLTCRFAAESLVDQLTSGGGHDVITPQRLMYTGQDPIRTGVDLFLLEFSEVPFPLSLILSESSLATYRLLFRHLFFAKHVERKLVMVWQDHLATKEFVSIRGAMGATYLLRQRMLHCVQNLIYYMMFEVIEPNWLQMMTEMTKETEGQTVDGLNEIHQTFLHRTLEACLLTDQNYVLAFTRVMQTCLLFAKQMETFIKKVRLHQDRHQIALENRDRVQKSLHARGSGLMASPPVERLHRAEMAEKKQRSKDQARRLMREVSSPEFRRMISHYETTFTKHLRAFMKIVTKSDDRYHTQKLNLCTRLDFNGFVSYSMGLR